MDDYSDGTTWFEAQLHLFILLFFLSCFIFSILFYLYFYPGASPKWPVPGAFFASGAA